MTNPDLRTLRRALRAPEDPPGLADPVDLAAIIRQGRALRRRRRCAAVAGGAAAVALVFGALTAITGATRPATVPAPTIAPAISGRTVPVSTAPGRTGPGNTASPRPSPSRRAPRVAPIGSTPEPSATASPTGAPTPVPTGAPTPVPTPTGLPTTPATGVKPLTSPAK